MSERRPGWPYKREFACHRCGNCCRGEGFVDVTESEIERAARFLGITAAEFIRQYCQRTASGGFEVISQGDVLQSCIFLFEDEKGLFGCRIHGAKPDQCAAFPFNWRPRDAEEYCAGLRALAGREAPTRRTMSKALDQRLAKELKRERGGS
jgi:Fe-S-cluster containining protein